MRTEICGSQPFPWASRRCHHDAPGADAFRSRAAGSDHILSACVAAFACVECFTTVALSIVGICADGWHENAGAPHRARSHGTLHLSLHPFRDPISQNGRNSSRRLDMVVHGDGHLSALRGESSFAEEAYARHVSSAGGASHSSHCADVFSVDTGAFSAHARQLYGGFSNVSHRINLRRPCVVWS